MFFIFEIKSIEKEKTKLKKNLYSAANIQIFGFLGKYGFKFKNKKVFLDLAHCSLDTAKWHLKNLDNRKIVGTCISGAKGKYYNFNGGGIILDCRSINKIKKIKSNQIISKNIPAKILLKGVYNKYSTRIMLEQNKFNDNEINKLRKKGHHISDGLYDNITNTFENRKYFWKNCV